MVKQERAARTRQSLIRAAAEVFAQDGFAPASLNAISRRAGVSNGALHFHFETKLALAQAVHDEARETVRGLTQLAPPGDGGGALQVLVDATHGLMRRLAEDVVVRAGFELCNDLSRGDVSELRWAWQQWIEDTLRRADREGLLAEGVSPEAAAPAIMAATVGFEVLGSANSEWLSEQRIARFWDLMLPRLAGVCQEPAISSHPTQDVMVPGAGQDALPPSREEQPHQK
ncbi:ScbR family autoregulator-binding transcription factor [Streptomyces sp. NBC_01304]|uniref:ScbR family autoregulator-binding transcription factor n=1 Tax=Streptomyces sp. NBC_01304 TaxID=2903818 RepID=UPI002E0EB5A2|nr:TetR/AcrR family transcriptional regulator [Streptomyces sp. NBC_01304]